MFYYVQNMIKHIAGEPHRKVMTCNGYDQIDVSGSNARLYSAKQHSSHFAFPQLEALLKQFKVRSLS